MNKPQTWRDWMPDGSSEPTKLLTRDQLVEQLNQYGVPVETHNLRYWERIGIVPKPLRRWHQGATRTIYPQWMTALIVSLRDMQAEGMSLPEIGAYLRSDVMPHIAKGDLAPKSAFLLASMRRHRDLLNERIKALEASLSEDQPA